MKTIQLKESVLTDDGTVEVNIYTIPEQISTGELEHFTACLDGEVVVYVDADKPELNRIEQVRPYAKGIVSRMIKDATRLESAI